MNLKYSTIPLAVAVTTLVGLAKPSLAQNVQAFANGEAQRISQDVGTGRVTPNQAQGLVTRDMQIQQQAQSYAMRNGGYLTPGQQNKVSSELQELDRRRRNDERRDRNGYMGNNMMGYGNNMMGYNPLSMGAGMLPYGTGMGSGLMGYGTGLGSGLMGYGSGLGNGLTGYGSGLGSLARNVLGGGNTMYAGYTPSHNNGILGSVGNTLLSHHPSVPFTGNYATPFSQGTNPKHTWHL